MKKIFDETSTQGIGGPKSAFKNYDKYFFSCPNCVYYFFLIVPLKRIRDWF